MDEILLDIRKNSFAQQLKMALEKLLCETICASPGTSLSKGAEHSLDYPLHDTEEHKLISKEKHKSDASLCRLERTIGSVQRLTQKRYWYYLFWNTACFYSRLTTKINYCSIRKKTTEQKAVSQWNESEEIYRIVLGVTGLPIRKIQS